ncbi:MAG: DNA-processing protein DprA [Pseudomonadota bacterium]|nr:DNA-processing protein DprA [Pseudomonadota bacterium]
MDDDAFDRIRLLRSPNIGPVTYRQLLARFGSGQTALAALPDLAARGRTGRGGGYRAAPESLIAAEIVATGHCGARYLFHDSPDYPALLRQVNGAPPILFARGTSDLAQRTPVALVGARNASAAAIRLSREFARTLAEAGNAVVSGLARGIDAAAHRGALGSRVSVAAGGGGTIAVIASGIDVVYPPDHAELQDEIAEQGLLLTEMPPGTEPIARHFPARNRIIAGIAEGTLVLEAAPKSGSLITARLAGELGREVMAVPGSPLDPRSHGCNQLIRDGAVLVQRAEDVIELLTSFRGVPRSHLREDGSDPYVAEAEEASWIGGAAQDDAALADIVALLTTAPVSVDELIRQTGDAGPGVQLALIELELAGRLERHAGGRVSLSE